MLKEYLKRISYSGKLSPSPEVLTEIHRLHLLSIPFENLDIHLHKKLILDKDHLVKKILIQNRGGYCYELNGMFYLLLKEIGFKVKMISARVSDGKGGWGPEFDHMALIVEFENGKKNYLADVGFGDNFISPLLFETGKIQRDDAGFFKITKEDNDEFILKNSADGIEFRDGYKFTAAGRRWKDFEEMNEYQQTSENSHFTKNRVCSIATAKGRISLSSSKLTLTESFEKKITEINGDKDFDRYLSEYFQIKL
ncbi:MAG TPA: arylamine N-acetyltransferase [Ignavibacteria bacterium]|nr:acetyltransferase [Bacteroidota bacterium]HRI85802.1 arylamine N-acetyltransferase [Ignavibacteria bacterium]HRJ98267.1 arylamine N-acetyltransferase [Ignavibacteria bacterium]